MVEAGIIKLLKLQEPVLIKGGFNRPNIQYTVCLPSGLHAVDTPVGLSVIASYEGSSGGMLHMVGGFNRHTIWHTLHGASTAQPILQCAHMHSALYGQLVSPAYVST